MAELISIILAAGKGTRMKSNLPKVLHKICGKPMLGYLLDITRSLSPNQTIVITSHKAEVVEKYLDNGVKVIRQTRPLGTGDAVKSVKSRLANFDGNVLVLYADTPLIKPRTLKKLLLKHNRSGACCTLLTAVLKNPSGYGRILKDSKGNVLNIVEEKDATPEQRFINEVNVGVYCFRTKDLFKALDKVKPDNKKGEYYLTDTISILADEGQKVGSMPTTNHDEFLGINSRQDMVKAQDVIRFRIMERLMSGGVTIVDPTTTYIENDVKIGPDTIIYPMTMIEHDVTIGKGCEVGPFARIRTGTKLKSNAHIGNYVEVVRSKVGKGSKAKHLTYLGDVTIGRKVNVGAGTIVANYDGKNKTQVKDGAFIGSGSILIAPVKIGKDAITGAGAVVTKNRNVPDKTIVIGIPARVLKKQRTVRNRKGGQNEYRISTL